MIEANIKKIIKTQKVTRTKTAQELKTLSRRLTKHDKQFQTLTSSIALLPTQDVITKTIQDTIKVVVNGKIDKLSGDMATANEKIDLVGEHLKRQDAAMDVMSAKIKPFDGLRAWATETVTGLLYFGGLAAAVWAIIKLFHIKI